MMKKAYIPLTLIALLPLALFYACDSANPVAPSGTVLTLTVSPTTIGLNGSATVTVTGFRPDGNPLNPGTQVTLATSLGVISPTTVSIGTTGTGTATLTGDGRTGTATITATTPGGGDSMATVDVQIGETAETKPVLTITVSPSTLGLNETATVSVIARNADGSNFGSGGQVILETSLGQLAQTTLTTNSEGRAQTTFNSGEQTGSAEITGFIGSSDQAMTTVTIENQRPTLVITVTPSSIGLNETAEVSLLARDSDGLPVSSGVEILLETTLGSLDSARVLTNSEGRAATRFNSGSQPGTAEIRGFIGSSEQATAMVTIEERRPVLIISANPSIIPVGGTSQITIIARDSFNNPLGEGERIRLTASLGVVPSEVFTDQNGEAEVTFTAGDQASSNSNPAGVTAILRNSEAVTVNITIRDAVRSLSLTANTNDVDRVEEGDQVVLTARTRNAQGDPVAGIVVEFTSDVGSFSPDEQVPTNPQGEASTTLTVTREQLQSIPAGGTFTVTATVNSEGQTFTQMLNITVNGAP